MSPQRLSALVENRHVGRVHEKPPALLSGDLAQHSKLPQMPDRTRHRRERRSKFLRGGGNREEWAGSWEYGKTRGTEAAGRPSASILFRSRPSCDTIRRAAPAARVCRCRPETDESFRTGQAPGRFLPAAANRSADRIWEDDWLWENKAFSLSAFGSCSKYTWTRSGDPSLDTANTSVCATSS